jgi:hypothetical protein
MLSREPSLKTGLWDWAWDGLRHRRSRHSTVDCGCDAVSQENGRTEHDSERLECIAAYARAGYFNMGYVSDLFVVTPEIPLNDRRE